MWFVEICACMVYYVIHGMPLWYVSIPVIDDKLYTTLHRNVPLQIRNKQIKQLYACVKCENMIRAIDQLNICWTHAKPMA